MSLPRRDVKVWFDDPVHKALRRFCERRGITMGEWVENLVTRELTAAAIEAVEVADDIAPLLGISRNGQGPTGTVRNHSERAGKPRSGPARGNLEEGER